MSEPKKKLRLKRKLFLTLLYTVVIFAFVKAFQIFFQFPQVDVLKSSFPVMKFTDIKTPVKVVWEKEKPKAWLDIQKLPKRVYGAFIVSEDWEFFNHRGFDYNQIQESILEDLKTGTFKRGGSTITQQLVKNLYLEQEKSLLRKYKELVLSTELEERFPKMTILETYLNVVEMGVGIYGLTAAAQLYFKKTPYNLTAKEAAFVAMLLPSPKRYSVSYRKRELTRYARGTINNILRKMKAGGFISEETMNVELESPLSFEKIVPVVTPEEATQEMPLDETVQDENKSAENKDKSIDQPEE
ncbi:MAG: biosynthetic peptidoglycan transglycosylase [Bacteriovoracaceae bacterium]